MEATTQQIKEWQEKYGEGNVMQLSSGDKHCYIFNPASNIEKWKIAITARRKGVGALVDCVLNNCWIAGDEAFKSDDAMKLDLEDQVDELVDLPDPEMETLENGNILIKADGLSIEVKKATRLDIRFAQDRNKDNKPLITQVFLLDRIAVSQEQLEVIRKNDKVYAAVLFAVNEIKDSKEVQIKKF